MKAAELETLHKLYEAHVNPSAYQAAVDAFRAPFQDVRTMLHVEGWKSRAFSLSSVYSNLTTGDMQEMAQLSHLNPLLSERDVKQFGPRLYSSREYVTRDAVRNSEFFDIVLRPKDELDMAYAFTVLQDPDMFFGFSATVPRGYSEADRADLEAALERIRPHVQRSFQLARELVQRTAQGQAGSAIERIGTPIAVFDEKHRLVAQNIKAEEFFRKGGTLALSAVGDLISRHQEVAATLRLAAEQAARTQLSIGPVRVPREGGRALMLYFVPTGEPEGINPLVRPFVEGLPAYLVYVLDPDDVDPAPIDVLTLGLGLSPAEARLSQALHEGRTVQEAAADTGTSYSTARNQLASITRKLDLARQSELTGLLARLFARVPR